MRVLIVAAVLACAAAAPSGLLASPYGLGLGGIAVGHAAPLAIGHGPALPTISPGDIAGAAIDAHVDAHDHVRASVDAAREYHDQASEVQGQAINAAEDHSWQAIDAVKTQQAQLDGAAAGVAPILAKQLVGHGSVVATAPVAAGYGLAAGYGAPLAASYGAPLAAGYGAPLAAGYGGYAGNGLVAGYGGSKTVVTQSLQQSHPAPLIHAPVAIGHGAALGYAHGGAW